MAKDYYQTLGVDQSASKEEIKKAYKKLAKKFHPDVNKNDNAADKFKEINEAAAVLGDDKRREQYDRFGTTADQFNGFQGFDFGDSASFGGGFDDIFDAFFGGNPIFGNRRRRQSQRGSDLVYDMEITLKEAAHGIKKHIKIPKMDKCPKCNGRGAEKESDIEQCNTCHGSGYMKKAARTPFGIFQTTTTCSTCNGQGTQITNKCSTCSGSGRVHTERKIEVSIPAGVDNDSSLRISNEGEVGENNSPPGDLYIRIHIEENEIFERRGSDIYTQIGISFVQAVFGDEIEVPTIDSKARMNIPAGTDTNTLFRLKGKGMKKLRGYGVGDEYVRVIIKTPKKLSKKQKEVLMDYAKMTRQDISPGKGFFSKLKEALR